MIFAIVYKAFYCILNIFYCVFLQHNSGFQLTNSICNAALFRCLRKHYKRNAVVKTFIYTVHSAVRNKNISLRKNGNLVYILVNRDIFRKIFKFCHICKVSDRHNYLKISISKSLYAVVIETCIVIYHGSHRNIN